MQLNLIYRPDQWDIWPWRHKPDRKPPQDSWVKKPCFSPYHKFPSMLYIPPGQSHTHTCPACGNKITVVGNGPIL